MHLDINTIKSELLDTRIFCGRYFPFIVIPLSYAKIIASKQIPTAGVNKQGHIAINPDWWATLTIESKRFTIIHECLHAVLCHPFRTQQYNPTLYNIAADAKVNHAISEANISGITFQNNEIVTLYSLATITKLHVTDLQKMSTEEITQTLQTNPTPSLNQPNNTQNSATNSSDKASVLGDDLFKDPFKGKVIQKGESALEGVLSEQLGKMWRQICEKAKTFAKQAGTLPAAFERLVDEVLEVKPPWQTILRFGLRSDSGCDSSFAYPNRRSNDLPGSIGYTGTVWCLIDTSGSITQDMLKTFLGIAKHEARQASIRVIPWDAAFYEVLKAERPSEVARRIASKMKGGGGTTCLPVLQKVYKLLNPNDAIIILTDGDIFDAEKQETKEMFTKVANKAGFKMIGYTHRPLKVPRFSSVHIAL